MRINLGQQLCITKIAGLRRFPRQLAIVHILVFGQILRSLFFAYEDHGALAAFIDVTHQMDHLFLQQVLCIINDQGAVTTGQLRANGVNHGSNASHRRQADFAQDGLCQICGCPTILVLNAMGLKIIGRDCDSGGFAPTRGAVECGHTGQAKCAVLHLIDEAPFDLRTVLKRALDVSFSLAALVLLSPLLLAIALAVKLSSPGPVLYKQTRMGLNGQTFEILKFRSMPVNAEAATGAVWSKPGETRATRVGAFLRRTSLVDRARPVLRRLMEQTGETANLGIEKEGHVLFVSQVETHASIRAFFPPGSLSQMHASGIGKALLAQMEASRLDRLLAATRLEVFTDHTITDGDALKQDLAAIRTQGFAVDNEEKNAGMRCIAAPVFDMNREAVAGISVSGPTSRISEQEIAELSRPVIEAAEQLTQAIGGVAPVAHKGGDA